MVLNNIIAQNKEKLQTNRRLGLFMNILHKTGHYFPFLDFLDDNMSLNFVFFLSWNSEI
jgi:hypothetical protein